MNLKEKMIVRKLMKVNKLTTAFQLHNGTLYSSSSKEEIVLPEKYNFINDSLYYGDKKVCEFKHKPDLNSDSFEIPDSIIKNEKETKEETKEESKETASKEESKEEKESKETASKEESKEEKESEEDDEFEEDDEIDFTSIKRLFFPVRRFFGKIKNIFAKKDENIELPENIKKQETKEEEKEKKDSKKEEAKTKEKSKETKNASNTKEEKVKEKATKEEPKKEEPKNEASKKEETKTTKEEPKKDESKATKEEPKNEASKKDYSVNDIKNTIESYDKKAKHFKEIEEKIAYYEEFLNTHDLSHADDQGMKQRMEEKLNNLRNEYSTLKSYNDSHKNEIVDEKMAFYTRSAMGIDKNIDKLEKERQYRILKAQLEGKTIVNLGLAEERKIDAKKAELLRLKEECLRRKAEENKYYEEMAARMTSALKR